VFDVRAQLFQLPNSSPLFFLLVHHFLSVCFLVRLTFLPRHSFALVIISFADEKESFSPRFSFFSSLPEAVGTIKSGQHVSWLGWCR